uniref:Uncharacterized protein n=1 Tax=Panagrolaimus sp. PS1159 TaxID=55785 RepID=A0AC35EZ07_9BILA
MFPFHASNQPLAIHLMFSTRSIAVFFVAFILFFEISWRNFLCIHSFLFILSIVANFIFVNESPRWLRRHGKLSEYSTLVVDFGKKLGRTINGESSIFADDLESRDPEKRSPLPTPAELTALTGF